VIFRLNIILPLPVILLWSYLSGLQLPACTRSSSSPPTSVLLKSA
jgi:hypothetical protein